MARTEPRNRLMAQAMKDLEVYSNDLRLPNGHYHGQRRCAKNGA